VGGTAPGEVRWGGDPAGSGRPPGVGAAARERSTPGGAGAFGSFIGLGEIAQRIRHEPARARVRLALALAGWPPIGLAIALAFGELTGCARFAATCASTSSFSSSVLAAQVVVLALLLLIPQLARIAAFGSLAVLLAALPIVAFLTAAGATYDPEPGTAALLALLSVAWGIGVVIGLPFRSRTMPP
jgi:hypothetical protein